AEEHLQRQDQRAPGAAPGAGPAPRTTRWQPRLLSENPPPRSLRSRTGSPVMLKCQKMAVGECVGSSGVESVEDGGWRMEDGGETRTSRPPSIRDPPPSVPGLRGTGGCRGRT